MVSVHMAGVVSLGDANSRAGRADAVITIPWQDKKSMRSKSWHRPKLHVETGPRSVLIPAGIGATLSLRMAGRQVGHELAGRVEGPGLGWQSGGGDRW